MVCSLLQTYTKLRQLPRLFSELLSVICQPALDELRPPLLSEGVSSCLRTCLLDAPPSQGLEIGSLVLESIKRHLLPDLSMNEMRAEKMEVDEEGGDKGEKTEFKVDQKREDASLKLFSLSQLLHAVLFSLKTLDSSSPVPLVRQSQCLMEEMHQLVKEFLGLLSTGNAGKTSLTSSRKTPKKGKKISDHRESVKVVLWEQKTQEAILLLKYTCVEVDTCFHIHCSKYTPLDVKKDEALLNDPVPSHIESLACGDILPSRLHPSPSCSPLSCFLLKLLTLQQMKKVLMNNSLIKESSTAPQLNMAAQFILAKSELETSLDGEQMWDGQVSSVNANSYHVAHWYLVTTNLPLIAPYLSEEDMGCIADFLVSSLLRRQTDAEDRLRSCLTFSLISSQLLQSPVLAELPPLFTATVRSITQRMSGVLVAAHSPKVCPTLLNFQTGCDSSQIIVEDILTSSKTGDVFMMLTGTQTKELVNLLQILTNLNPDAMSSENLCSVFLLLFFTLTSTSALSDPVDVDRPDPGDDARFLVKLLRILTRLLEGRNFQSVLKLIHGGSLLEAAVSCLVWRSNSGRFQAACSPDWLGIIKAAQDFIGTLVQLIIIRNSSVRLNLDQFASFLTSKEMANSSAAAAGKPGSIQSVHLLLASLSSFSQAMTSNLGKSKPIDETLTHMLTRTTASLGPGIESFLKPQPVGEAVISILSQAFVVEVVAVMLHCELSCLSVEDGNKLTLSHMSLYQSFYQQILREMTSALRPLDFLLASLRFLSTFYKAVMRTGGVKEELYVQILQSVHRLLTGTGAQTE